MRCGKISKKLLRLISLTCLFILRHGQKLCENIFSYVWHNSFFVRSHFCALDEANIFLSSHFFITSISSFWHIYERSRRNSKALSHILTNTINFFTIIILQLEKSYQGHLFLLRAHKELFQLIFAGIFCKL